MNANIRTIILKNFLGDSAEWYKFIIISFLVMNPVFFLFIDPFIASWILVFEFIFTLTMALKCYPLQPGGLLAIEAIIIGMTSPKQVSYEIHNNIEVILLLIFMLAGIYFMKKLLLFIFTKLLLSIYSKRILSLTFFLSSALLSAFLDAMTVISVVISVGMGFFFIYYNYISKQKDSFYLKNTEREKEERNRDIKQFRSFLRSLTMHSSVGSVLGGAMTMVGEPQNLIITKCVGWNFGDFFLHMLPVTLPVFIFGLIICYCVEYFQLFGYGAELPEKVRNILQTHDENSKKKRDCKEKIQLISQALVGIWLIISLGFHLAEVSLIGLSIIILITSLCGIVDEKNIGKAFRESLPFTSLLIVFFSIVSVITDQDLFRPLIQFALKSSTSSQLFLFYLFNGLLSAISDNVFVATIYINEAMNALKHSLISRQQYEYLAVAINAGTNLPSIATPNGQGAFLFLLTSAFSPTIRLSYGRMLLMAFPYTIVITLVGLLAIKIWLIPITEWFALLGLITSTI